jgi:hypothetical protein
MDRRTSLQWMLAAASLPGWVDAAAAANTRRKPRGYGTDPDLVKRYRSGELWPLTFTEAQRQTAAALCGLVIPADEQSPSAAQLGVHLFIDEWISAPYPEHTKDRRLILEGLAWLDREAKQRFGRTFVQASATQQQRICDDICWQQKAAPRFAQAAKFFARWRDLTAGGFYTTPEGAKDLRFVGNTPSPTFDGPPIAVLQIVGVA